jgi:hypothetical protein
LHHLQFGCGVSHHLSWQFRLHRGRLRRRLSYHRGWLHGGLS